MNNSIIYLLLKYHTFFSIGTWSIHITRTICVLQCWGRGGSEIGITAFLWIKLVGNILIRVWYALLCQSPGLGEVGGSLCHLTVLSYCPSSKQEDCHKLTDQQQALNQGQNPLPIYLSLNVKDKISDQDFRGNNTPEFHLTFNLGRVPFRTG